ncbi:hypothetical protein [Flavicella sediminum]|uniref:hypothetical protein n=1 Tax=Flavicella sediminum TaxID=2585141 RepID=UPI001FB618FF|nr:hypothetical protein [Flavicella sediminum]
MENEITISMLAIFCVSGYFLANIELSKYNPKNINKNNGTTVLLAAMIIDFPFAEII